MAFDWDDKIFILKNLKKMPKQNSLIAQPEYILLTDDIADQIQIKNQYEK
jgi:hypothetical protein